MSVRERAGVRAARVLLSLVEESSVEELQAAESILGPKELVEALQLLRRFKEHEQVTPVTLKQLREIVRVEMAALPLSMHDITLITARLGLGSKPLHRNSDVDWAPVLADIDAASISPRDQADSYVRLLFMGAEQAGPAHLTKVLVLLRDLAIRALTGNVVFFPTLNSLAELRTMWFGTPLPHSRGESRRSLVTRLLAEAEREQPVRLDGIVHHLLLEGLRSPTDNAATAMREQKSKKAHGA